MVQLCRSVDTTAVSLACRAIQIEAKVSHVVICMRPPISVLYLQFQYMLPELFLFISNHPSKIPGKNQEAGCDFTAVERRQL